MEDQLRSLAPRSPSERVKARIFASSSSVARPDQASGAGFGWMAPVLASFAILLAAESSRYDHQAPLAAMGVSSNWLAMAASNQSYAAYIVADFHSGQNSPQMAPIEMAGLRNTPEPEFWPSAVTNSLMR
jgi:hypothetical protein